MAVDSLRWGSSRSRLVVHGIVRRIVIVAVVRNQRRLGAIHCDGKLRRWCRDCVAPMSSKREVEVVWSKSDFKFRNGGVTPALRLGDASRPTTHLKGALFEIKI